MKNWAIDLGTTNSSIAFADSKKAEVIKLSNGESSQPSVVIFSKGKLKVAESRKRKNYDLTRESGELFEEWKITGMVDETTAGKPFLSKEGKKIAPATPINLSAQIITALVSQAEKKTGDTIKKISVSIPANFKEPARLTTLDAIRKACPKIEEIKLIHEPTAAAASLLSTYNIDKIIGKNILVYDMGGGTLDISIVKFKKVDGVVSIDVSATNGLNIAGKSFDSIILNKFIIPKIASQLSIKKPEIKQNVHELKSLMFEAEKIKLALAAEESDFEQVVPFTWKGKKNKINVNVEYVKFIQEINGLLSQTNNKVEEVLKKSSISKDKIDIVVLAGSSTRAPWIKSSIKEYFGEEKIADITNPETAIAVGGAILSGINYNGGVFKFKGSSLEINEISPTFVGIKIAGNVNSWMIEKGAKLPIKSSQVFYAPSSGGIPPSVFIMVSDNKIVNSSRADLFSIVDISNSIKKIEPNEKIEFELEYGNKMSLSLNVIFRNERYEINPTVSPSKMKKSVRDKKETLEFEKEVLNQYRSLPSSKLESDYKDAIKFFKSKGHDVSHYKNNDISKEEKASLIGSFTLLDRSRH